MSCRRLATFLLCALSVGALQTARAGEIARNELAIIGVGLEVDRNPVSAATSVPSFVQTIFGGRTNDEAVASPGLAVLGELVGPGIDTPLTLSTLPGRRFAIPALHVKGEYTLQNIRLVDADAHFLQPAVPSFATILVADVLTTDVRVRQLTPAELRERGIPLDSSWEVYEYVVVVAIAGGETVEVPYLVTIDKFSRQVVPPPSGGQSPPPLPNNGPRRRWVASPPKFFDLGPAEPLPEAEEEEEKEATVQRPRLPAALVIPTGFGVLHQFFAVVLRVANASDAAGVRLDSISATIDAPSSMRVSKVVPAVSFGQPVPIVDQQTGATYLIAGAQGSAEWTLEALESGTHTIELEVRATYQKEGEPDFPMSGNVSAAIVVSDPRFQINFSHPDVVREGAYTAHAFVTNLSEQAQHIALDLREIPLCSPPPGTFRNGICRDGAQELFELDLQPGEMGTVPYRLRSAVTGRAYAAAAAPRDASIGVSVMLTMGVDPQLKVPLSPATLLMPHYAQYLPQPLVSANLELLGIGYSLATAPLNKFTASQPRVIASDVFRRAQQLALAGQRIFVTRRDATVDDAAEDRDAIIHASLDLLDNVERVDELDRELELAEWDELRRTHDSGRGAAAAMARELERTARATPVEFVDDFAAIAAHRSPFFFAYVHGPPIAGDERPYALSLTGRTSGARLDVPSEASGGFVRDLPFGELSRLAIGGAAGELALVGRWKEDLRVTVTPSTSTFTLHLIYPDDANGSFLRSDIEIAGATAGVPVAIEVLRGSRTLVVQNAPGAPLVEVVEQTPLRIIGAAQDLHLDPSGHVVSLLFNRPATIADGSKWRDRLALTINVPAAAYTAIRKNDPSSGELQIPAAIPQEDARLLNITFDKVLSQNAAYVIDADAIGDRSTGAIAPPLQVVPRVDNARPGAILTGRVLRADNTAASSALVVLSMPRAGAISIVGGPENLAQADITGADGRFMFEYVPRDIDRGFNGLYDLTATLPDGKITGLSGAVRRPGEVHTVNLVFLGRGRARGFVRYDDGEPIAGARVSATSPLHPDSFSAVTDASGAYEMEVGVGPLTFAAFDRDSRPTFASAELRQPGEVITQDLVIPREARGGVGTLRIGVRRADNDEPMSGALVVVALRQWRVTGGLTDANGTFNAYGVPAGIVTVLVEHDYATAAIEVDLAADQTLETTVRLDVRPLIEYATLQGIVTRDDPAFPGDASHDQIVAGALIAITGVPTAVTAADGAFVIEDVPTSLAGTAVTIYDPQTGRRGWSHVPTLAAGNASYLPIRLSTTAYGSATMRVRLFNARGEPVSGYAVLKPGYPPETLTEKSSGVYEIEGVRVPQNASVVAVPKAGSSYGDQFAGERVRVDFDGQIGVTDIRLPGSGTIAVRLETEQPCGTPPCYAPALGRVALTYLVWDSFTQGESFKTIEAETDPTTGVATFANVPARQNLTIATVAHPFGHASDTAFLGYDGDAHEVTLRLSTAGEVAGRVFAYDGVTPVAGANVRLVTAEFADSVQTAGADGSFRFPAVAANTAFQVVAEASRDNIYRTGMFDAKTPAGAGPLTGLRVVMREQSSVEGVVVDGNDAAVPLARYWLSELSWPYRQLGTKLTPLQADINGRFVVANVFAGPFRMTAVAPDNQELRGDYQGTIGEEGDASQRSVRVVIGAAGAGSVAVTVVDPLAAFEPVENAEVALKRNGERFDFTSTNANGVAYFEDVPSGSYTIGAWSKARARGGESDVFRVFANEATPLSVELDFRGVIAGDVSDPDSEPAPGAPVTGEPVTVIGDGSKYTLRDSTDSAGTFEFVGVPEGRFRIFAMELGTERVAKGPDGLFISSLLPEQRNVHLELERYARLTVKVHLPDDAGGPGELAPLAEVFASQLDTAWGNNSYDRSFQGNPIVFEKMLQARGYSLRVRELGGEGRTAHVVGYFPAGVYDHEQVVTLPASGTVEVFVHDAGNAPVADAFVHASTQSKAFDVYTGSDGVARLIGAPLGPVSITVRKGAVSAAASGELLSRTQPLRIDLSLGANTTITGIVETETAGQPSIGTRVVLTASSRLLTRPIHLEALTDTNGAYSFAGIPAGGTSLSLVYFGEDETTIGASQNVALPDATTGVFALPSVRLDTTQPRILSIDPPPNSTEASPSTVVTIVFSEQIAASYLSRQYFDLRAADEADAPVDVSVQGSVRVDGTFVVRLVPPAPPAGQRFPLKSNVLYRLVVSDAIRDVTGHRLRAAVGTNFTTVDYTEPAIVGVMPLETEPIVEGESFRIRFNKAIDLSSFDAGNGGIVALDRLATYRGETVAVVPVVYSLDANDASTLVVAPQGVAIEPASFYRLTIAGVRDTSSPPNVQKETRVFEFFSFDREAPIIRIVSPVADGEPLVSGVAYAATIEATNPSGDAVSDVKYVDWLDARGASLGRSQSAPFAFEFVAPAGPTHTFQASATDLSLNTSDVATFTWNVIPNSAPGNLSIVSAPASAYPSKPVETSVSFSDEGLVTTVLLKLRATTRAGDPIEQILGSQKITRSSTSEPFAPAVFHWSLPVDLAPGPALLIAEATDSVNLRGTAEVVFQVLDDTTSPQIVSFTPEAESRYRFGTDRASYVIDVETSDGETGIAGAVLRVDGAVVSDQTTTDAPSTYRFRHTIQVPPRNTDTRIPIEITLRDHAGNETTQTHVVIYERVDDATVPEAAWISPLDGAALPANLPEWQATLRVRATDDVKVTAVRFVSQALAAPIVVNDPKPGSTDVFEAAAALAMPQDGAPFVVTATISDGDPLHDVELPITIHPVVPDITITGDVGITPSTLAQYDGKSVAVRGSRVYVGVPLALQNLIVIDGGVVSAPDETALQLSVADRLFVDADSSIDVSGKGWLGGLRSREDNSFRNTSRAGLTVGHSSAGGAIDAGASHGGIGGAVYGVTNATYGSIAEPREFGSGGAAHPVDTRAGANGGGAVALQAGDGAGWFAIAGVIRADAETRRSGVHWRPGAGGSIDLRARALVTGAAAMISANGADDDANDVVDAGGGGGRVAVRVAERLDLASPSIIQARGGRNGTATEGAEYVDGGAGTIYLQRPGDSLGALIVSAADSRHPATTHRTAGTPLPATGFSTLIAGPRALVRLDEPFDGAREIDPTAAIVEPEELPEIVLQETVPAAGAPVPRGGSLEAHYAYAARPGAREVRGLLSVRSADVTDYPAFATENGGATMTIAVPSDAALGPASLAMRILDRAGRSAETPAVQFEIIENAAPSIESFDVTPATETFAGHALTVVASASDDVAVSDLTLRASVGTVRVISSEVSAPSMLTRSWEIAIPPDTPAATAIELTLSAGDAFPGHAAVTATRSVVILADTVAPSLEIVAPSTGAEIEEGSGATFELVVEATDAEVAVRDVVATWNGTEYALSSSGTAYRATLPVPGVDGTDPVARTVEVRATDYAGNTTTSDRTLQVIPLVDPNAAALQWVCGSAGMMAAPDDTVRLRVSAVPASTTNGVTSVMFSFDTDAPIGAASVATNIYEASWKVPADAADESTVPVRVVVRTVAGNESVLLGSITFVAGATRILTSSLLAADDPSFENQSLIVAAGGTLTIVGAHRLKDLVVLDGGKVIRQSAQGDDAIVTLQRLYVACGGLVDASGGGYAKGQSEDGAGVPDGESGGSHIGRGSVSHRAAGATFGSIERPVEWGGGGHATDPAKIATGGGAIHIEASRSIAIDGNVRANGVSAGSNGFGGGAGGSIWMTTDGAFTGAGSIQATGTYSSQPRGVGGGGAISLEFESRSGTLWSKLDASGGYCGWGNHGGAGSVYVRSPSSTFGDLVLDNRGKTSSSTMTELPSFGLHEAAAVNGSEVTIAKARWLSPSLLGHRVRVVSPDGAIRGTWRIASVTNDASTVPVSGFATIDTRDGVAYDGYILYSPDGIGGRAFVAARWANERWEYDDGTAFLPFNSRSGDVVIASFTRSESAIVALSTYSCATGCETIHAVPAAELSRGEIAINAVSGGQYYPLDLGYIAPGELFIRPDGGGASIIVSRGVDAKVTFADEPDAAVRVEPGDTLHGIYLFDSVTLRSAVVVTRDLLESATPPSLDAASSLATGNASAPQLDANALSFASGTHGAILIGATGAADDPERPVDVIAGPASLVTAPRWDNNWNLFIGERGGLSIERRPNATTGACGVSTLDVIESTGFVSFTAAQTNAAMQAGLAPADTTRAYAEPGIYAFRLLTGTYQIWINGVYANRSGPYTTATVFRIERDAGHLRFIVDGKRVHDVIAPPAALRFDVSTSAASAELHSIAFVNGSIGGPMRAAASPDGSFRAAVSSGPGEEVFVHLRDRHRFPRESSPVSAGVLPADLGIASFSISPSALTAGNQATGTVTLGRPAGAGGAIVDLFSPDDVLSLPSFVTIAAGAKSVAFAIETAPVAEAIDAQVRAKWGGSETTATLRIERDATPAAIVITSPVANAVYVEAQPSKLAVTATITDDDSGVARAWVTLEGQDYELVASGDRFTCEIPVPFVAGSESVVRDVAVTAEDRSGNLATSTVSIVIEPLVDSSEPSIEWLCGNEGAMYAAGTTARLRVLARAPNTNNAIERVTITVTGTSGSTAYAAALTSTADVYEVLLPVSGEADGTIVSMHAEAVAASGTSSTRDSWFRILSGAIEVSSNVSIAAGDTSYDGRSLVVHQGATVTIAGTHSFERLAVFGSIVTAMTEAVEITATDVFIDCAATIDATGKGYPIRTSYPGTTGTIQVAEGAPHIGRGAIRGPAVQAGATYGSIYAPREFGAGNYRNQPGGGAIRIETASHTTIDGSVLANGRDGGGEGAGAGGSIWITTSALSGAGIVQADGGKACWPGGGGAVAAEYDTESARTPTLYARPGIATCADRAGAGTVFVRRPGSTYGSAVVDTGGRGVGIVDLPSLGSGVAQAASAGSSLVTGLSASIAPYFVGHHVRITAPDGTVRGTWAIESIDGTTLVLAPNADEVVEVSPGDSWRGVYLFDDLTTRNVQIVSADLVEPAAMTIDGTVIAEKLGGGAIHIVPQAVLTHPQTRSLDIAIDGELRIDAGAAIDVTSRGYPVNTTYPGALGVQVVQQAGSHVGRGGAITAAGATYGSIYKPFEAGAGDIRNHEGGGIVRIRANEVVVNGAIRANGESGGGEGAGAGGSIQIAATALSGDGVIEAEGGGACWGGGGGAVAITTDTPPGSVPSRRARGGTGCSGRQGGAGTLYVNGDLAIDNTSRGVAVTELPSIGNGTAQPGTLGSILVTDRASDIPSYFVGHTIALTSATGAAKGLWRVVEVSGRTIHLEPDGTSEPQAEPGDSWRGVYKIGVLTLRETQLISSDAITYDSLDIDTVSSIGSPP